MKLLDGLPVRDFAGNQTVFQAGEAGPLWRVVEGMVRLDRELGAQALSVQLALPGDLIGIEGLCDQPYQFNAVALTECRIEALAPLAATPFAGAREMLMRQVLLQQQDRLQDMARLRTGSVIQRMAHLLSLLGLPWTARGDVPTAQADAIRASLPALRELARMVDAQTETVCRALAQLLPPRSRKGGRSGFPAAPAPLGQALAWSAQHPGLSAAA